jgi:asparagine synthase (glutamine-hydrolysing)
MSGLCGWVGEAPPDLLERMLARIDYRGDRQDVWQDQRAGLGYRWWGGRPGKAEGIWSEGDHTEAVTLRSRVVCCGTLAPPSDSPAASVRQTLEGNDLSKLDGAFAAAWWDGSKLTLARDPFGVRSVYYITLPNGTLVFASELKQLLAVPEVEARIHYPALHKYLTFSFVPGVDAPVAGVKRVPPGHLLTFQDGSISVRPYFELREEINPRLEEQARAVRFVRKRCQQAVASRLTGDEKVGLYLSGGLDSSAVAFWLKRAKQNVLAFSLDLGETSVEKTEASEVARHLEIPLTFVPAKGEDVAKIFWDLVWRLDMPFGDAVTGPQYLLGQAARQAGLDVVFNGEGGDQLFGGWTSKPMVAGALYSGLYGEPETLEELYLKSYHKFYSLEEELYSSDLQAQVGGPGQRRAILEPYLGTDQAESFLNRVRLADVWLKGALNILPRAERLTNGWGLDLRVPLFDRALAEASFALPPTLKMKGATEKYVLKLLLQNALPEEIVWRKKSGMSVPITDWCMGPLKELLSDLLGPESLARRGLFNPAFVGQLLEGQDTPNEVRRRRVGEKLWALAIVEGWMRVFVDGRGAKP